MVDKTIPDVLGFKLEDALNILQELHAKIETTLTKPYPDVEPSGELRVVKVVLTGDGLIKLTIVSEYYLKGGAQSNGIQNH